MYIAQILALKERGKLAVCKCSYLLPLALLIETNIATYLTMAVVATTELDLQLWFFHEFLMIFPKCCILLAFPVLPE